MKRWPAAVACVLWVPLALTITPFELPGPTWPWQLALGVLAAGLLARTPLDATSRRPPTLRGLGFRSLFGAIGLGLATLGHVLAGGGAFFMPPFLFIGAATILGALLGPVALFERHAAARPRARRTDAAAAVLTGWGVFLALCVGWVQARYTRELFSATDADAAVQAGLDGLLWITEDPLWTLLFFGWSAVPGATFAWARLRGWSVDRQVALGLGATGATWWLFPGETPVVTFGLACLAIALPVVSRVAELRPFAGLPPEPVEPEGRSWTWVVAVTLCCLTALGLCGREGWRAWRRRELEATAHAALPRFVAARQADPAPILSDLELVRRRAAGALVRDTATQAAVDLEAVSARLVELEEQADRLEAEVARAHDEVVALYVALHRNGGRITSELGRCNAELPDRLKAARAALSDVRTLRSSLTTLPPAVSTSGG